MKNRTIVFKIVLASIVLAIFIMSLYAYLTNVKRKYRHKFNTEPVIVENYTNTELKLLNEYKGDIYYNKKTNEITEEFDDTKDYNIIGKYGKIYTTPIKMIYNDDDEYNESSENQKYGVYKILNDEDNLYYLEDDKGNKSRKYNHIYPLEYENKNNKTVIDYLVLESDNTVSLFDYKNVKETNLNGYYINLFINSETTKDGNYTKYIIAEKENENNDRLFGLIDYEGNVILDFIYDSLSNIENNDKYIALKDGKYGVINSKGEIKEDFLYDKFYTASNYTIMLKNNYIGVKYNDKLVVNYLIQFTDNNIYYIDYEIIDDTLYLYKKINSDENSQSFWNKTTTYLINKKGIDKKIDSYLEPIKNYNDETDEYDTNYFYKINENNGKLLFTIYDLYLIEYYSFSIKYDKVYKYDISFTNYNNKDLYELEIIYNTDNQKTDYHYIDLFNSKIISEKDALLNILSNGYGFVLDHDNKLTIYKKDEKISEYKDIDYYLGDYYFSSNNKLYKLEFSK